MGVPGILGEWRTVVTAGLLWALAACAPGGMAPPAMPDDVPAASASPPAVAGEVKRLPPAPVASPVTAAPMFTATIAEITPETAARMTASWLPGCPVPLEDLRLVTVDVIGFGSVARHRAIEIQLQQEYVDAHLADLEALADALTRAGRTD